MPAYTCRPLGESAVVVDLGPAHDGETALRTAELAEGLASRLGAAACDVVPGYNSILVRFDALETPPDRQLREVGQALADRSEEAAGGWPARSPRWRRQPRDHIVRVCFGEENGVDFERIAHELGLRESRLRDLLCKAEFRVAFIGFLAGFPYLLGLPAMLAGVSRLARPRPRVPAGSVAIAAGQCGIYPRTAPGGWRLMGRTNATLFDPARDPATLFQPLDVVRFEPVTDMRDATVTSS